MSFWNALGRGLALILLIVPLGPIAHARAADPPLVIYSARKYQLVEQVFTDYGKLRGIEVKFVSDDGAPLIQRLIAEGRGSPADVAGPPSPLKSPVPSPATVSIVPAGSTRRTRLFSESTM